MRQDGAGTLKRLETAVKRRLRRWPALYALARRWKWRWVVRILGRRRGEARGHWDRMVGVVESGAHKGWLDWELVEIEHVRPQVSGDPQVYYLQHFFDRHVPHTPVERALSLGCGGGNLERALAAMGAAERIDGFDSSPESIRVAQQLASEAGLAGRLHYAVQDLDELQLVRGTYDFVIAKMALHHFERLEHIYEQVRRSLKPGGLFVFNEFVGPSRFQWTDSQLDLMNRLLEAVPDSVRRRAGAGRIVRPSVEEMIAMDPSESVRSAEILPLLDEGFEVVEKKPYGGTLLHVLLTQLMPGFDLDDECHLSLLRVFFILERSLVEGGVLPSDFAYVVARPRSAPS